MAGIMIKADDFIAKRKAIKKNKRYIGVEIENHKKANKKTSRGSCRARRQNQRTRNHALCRRRRDWH